MVVCIRIWMWMWIIAVTTIVATVNNVVVVWMWMWTRWWVIGLTIAHDDNDLRLSAAWDWRASHQVPLGQDRYWAMVRLQGAVFKRQPR